MTATELLTTCRQVGIRLEARGDRLRYEAPAGSLTPELRATLTEHKAELLSLLAAPQFVMLQPGGLTLPQAVIALAWDLEARGFQITRAPDGALAVEPSRALTAADHVALTRWHAHLSALCQFCDTVVVT